jgi:hypothetical protein
MSEQTNDLPATIGWIGPSTVPWLSEEDVQLALWPTPHQIKMRHRLFRVVGEIQQSDAELSHTQATPRVQQP